MMELQLRTGQVFGPDQLVKARVKRSIDPLFGYLQRDSMELTLLGDGELQPGAAIQTGAVLTHKGKTVATQQVQDCIRTGITQQLRCKTDLDFLKLEYMGGVYQNETAPTLLLELLGDRQRDYNIGLLDNISGHIPICTRKEALELLTFATGTCMQVNPLGEFVLRELGDRDPVVIPASRVLEGGQVVQLPQYSKAELVAHSYIPSQTAVYVFEHREFTRQEQMIKFSEPVHWISIGQSQVLAEGPNFIRFQAEQYDSLMVKPYLHGTQYLTRSFEDLPEHTRVLSVRENGLVNSSNCQKLLDKLCQRAVMRAQVKPKIRVVEETVGDLVTVQTPWGERYTGYITAMDSTYTPESHVAQITLMGQKEE